MIIGLYGKARTGKDTIGNYLKSSYGFIPRAFADAVKDVAKMLFNLSDEELYGDRKETPTVWYPREKSIILGSKEFLGKKGLFLTPREIIQSIGHCMRGVYQDIWIEKLLNNLEFKDHVITDIRYPNEYAAISRGINEIWKITRDIEGTVHNTHPSETSLDYFPNSDFDCVIQNNGTTEELYKRIDEECQKIGLQKLQQNQ